jgi:hypothetical protein
MASVLIEVIKEGDGVVKISETYTDLTSYEAYGVMKSIVLRMEARYSANPVGVRIVDNARPQGAIEQ